MGRKKVEERIGIFGSLKHETKHAVLGVLGLIITVFFGLSAGGLAGAAGTLVYDGLYSLVGAGFYLIPLVTLMLSISFFKFVRPNLLTHRMIGGIIFYLAGLGLINLTLGEVRGGMLGKFVGTPLLKLFDFYLSLTVLGGLILISIMVIFDSHLSFWRSVWNWLTGKRAVPVREACDDPEEDDEPELIVGDVKPGLAPLGIKAVVPREPVIKNGTQDEYEEFINRPMKHPIFASKEFVMPPVSLLERDSGKAVGGDVRDRANKIKRALENFGIMVEMDEISIGPSITRYAMKPAEGVKLSRIVALQNDLSLALAAHPLRIEAPIPGKSLVGIEIPNTVKATVGLASLVGAKEYAENTHPLLVSLGRGISGAAHFANLAKSPHILIAGATGSGKSVVIHTFITSLLYRNTPSMLQLILIDPKRVELTLYNKIPHLYGPVITDPKKAIHALGWLNREMGRRYETLEKYTVRDIGSYHKNIYNPAMEQATPESDPETLPPHMPYFVCVIDELADLMTSYPRELEPLIVRLTQMSRAVGIHLVLSTQRPSVEVITGLIKANVPSRIALQVASQIDSRTILDMAGAEKLLGAGDMLYLSGEMSKPLRLQSAFVTEDEVKKVVKFIIENNFENTVDNLALAIEADGGGKNLINIAPTGLNDENGDEENDDRYEEAREVVLQDKKASATYLQRRMGIGYGRAAKLLDIMEREGLIGPSNGAKPREIFGLSQEEENAQF